MTRARFVAGNPAVGDKFLKVAHAYVYQPKLDYGSLVEIARLRTRMETELAQEGKKGKNVKLGFGGLADIEFLAQVQQLTHGCRHPKLRCSNTLEALEALSAYGLIDHAQGSQLKTDYLFLRNLECALRLQSEKPESHLPKDREKIAQLAKLLQYQGKDSGELADDLMRDYAKTTARVRKTYSENLGVLLRTAR